MATLTDNPITGALASLGLLGLTGTLAPLVQLASLRDPRGSDGLLHVWGREMCRIAGVQSVVEGLEHVPDRTCVFVSNHQSHFDALVFFAHVRKHVRFIAKRELFRIPLFGPALRAAGNIEVNRTGGPGDRETLTRAIQIAQERTSVLFFPEGTRSDDGTLRDFKKGAAIFAIQSGLPIVPVAVAGTKDILKKNSLALRRGCKAALVIGEPMKTGGLVVEDRDALTRKMRDNIEALMGRAEALVEGMRRTT